MRSPLRHLFNPLPLSRRGGGPSDPLFACPDVVENDYWRMRRMG
jgi:hypothetical protein